MNRLNRQFVKLRKRSADENDVGVLLHDFNEADNLLSKLIEDTSAWRDGWSAILNHQERVVSEFKSLYAPIPGNTSGLQTSTTPDDVTSRTTKLHEDYVQLRQDLLAELNAVDDSMIRPARAAKDYIIPMKKTIKQRQDRKLDYEHYQSKYDGYAKKPKRSDRDNANMAKTEQELANAQDMYNRADDTLRERLPRILEAIYSLLPRILAVQIRLQNTMLAHYYTILHTFAEDYQFMSPPPPMDQVILEWEESHLPVREEIENFRCLINGKARQGSTAATTNNPPSPPSLRAPPPANDYLSPETTYDNDSTRPPSPASSYTKTIFSQPRNSIDTTYTIPESPETGPKPPSVYSTSTNTQPHRPSRIPSTSTIPTFNTPDYSNSNSPPKPLAPKPSSSNLSTTSFHTAKSSLSPALSSRASSISGVSATTTPMSTGYSPAGPSADYFTRQAASKPTTPKPTLTTSSSKPQAPVCNNSIDQRISSLGAAAAVAATKPRPPPPPKPKVHLVTALYDFQGQSEDDLVFYEGDKIRVIEKTASSNDWWQGELRGVKGYFPANYVG
ncbi:hypothetical protein SI65_09061 [Aspergillus cristatus]|uniref:SH3 domain-containing protein n=1 Tax=Aspergillus cristatus TaxID=573508 RepID=A0A1E3B3J4_ASPCR|nr:hypothetical protein SI65_09061 [Aspergillus cristatus]